jgi:hypothetical protein
MQAQEKKLEIYFENKITENISINDVFSDTKIPKYIIRNFTTKYKIKLKKINKSVTEDEILIIKQFIKEKQTITALATKLKRSIATIKNVCERHNIIMKFSNGKSRPWTNDENLLLQKHIEDGIPYRDISKIMKRGWTTIKSKAKEFNLSSENAAKIEYNNKLYSKGLGKCIKCNNVLNLIEFYKNNRSKCKKCTKTETTKNRINFSENTDLNTILKYRYSTSKTRAKKYNMTFDLTVENLIDLYNKQKGKCYYSGDILSFSSNNNNVLSIDRINSEKGYTIDNVVFCTAIINSMKNVLSIENFINIINKIYSHNKKNNY